MRELDRDANANAHAPGYDGSRGVMEARQAALEALINGGLTDNGELTQADEPYYPGGALGEISDQQGMKP